MHDQRYYWGETYHKPQQAEPILTGQARQLVGPDLNEALHEKYTHHDWTITDEFLVQGNEQDNSVGDTSRLWS